MLEAPTQWGRSRGGSGVATPQTLTKTRDLKITHPVRLRRFRLKFNGIGRRGFNQQKKVTKIRLRLVGVASFYWPRQIMIVQRRASYGGDYKVPVHS